MTSGYYPPYSPSSSVISDDSSIIELGRPGATPFARQRFAKYLLG